MAHFPPEDMTGAIVRCTRCLYGQLVRQRFAPPKRYPMPSASATGDREAFNAAELGRVVQIDPIKTTLKAPGTNLFTLKCAEPLSTSAFKFNLRRYSLA